MRGYSKIIKNEDGAVAILVALLMIVIMGFSALVIDIGIITLTKSELQNAADSAALAGAKVLSNKSNARSAANSYSVNNLGNISYENIPSANSNQTKIKLQDGTIVTSETIGANKIKVTCSRNVKYTFARVLGLNNTTVEAKATAFKSGIESGVSGIRPWALSDGHVYTYGLSFVLKDGGGDGYNGYYGVVSFGSQGQGADKYKGNITNGYNGTLKIGDSVNNVHGNNNVKQVINELLTRTGDTAYDSYNYSNAPADDSRVVIIPKINSSLIITGFCAIYLDSVDNKGNIYAHFLYDTTWSDENKEGHDDWGLNSKVKLIE